MKLRTLMCSAAIVASSLGAFGITTNDFKYAKFGDIKGDQNIMTNVDEVILQAMSGGGGDASGKADKFLPGKNLSMAETYCRLEYADDGTIPYKDYLYSSTTNIDFSSAVDMYDKDLNKLDHTGSGTGVDLGFDQMSGLYTITYDVPGGGSATVSVTNIVPVKGLVLNADMPEATTYGYSNPHDWKIDWEAKSDFDIENVDSSRQETNSVGQIYTVYFSSSLRKLMADLYVNYLDEVNVPDFNKVTFEVTDGPGVISNNNVLVASESGVVTVRGTTDKGDSREVPVSMYTYYNESTHAIYTADALAARNRICNYHLNLLQNYRSNPTTNRSYSTWNSPENTKHVGNPGDMFSGEYGKRYFPYQHTTANSGGDASWWWSHAPISKHVVLAAHHYGWNHTRILNGYAYCNWDGKFSGKVQVKYLQYIGLSEWAQANGFDGTDAQCGDIGVFIVRTMDDENVGIPDECLPYLATCDYLNQTYGGLSGSYSGTDYGAGNIPFITLNQANMVGLRTGFTLPDWSNWGNVACEEKSIDEPNNMLFRSDLYNYVKLGGWHGPVMGDSGKPVFLYDPALTTGLTYDFGNGPEPLLRPILLACHTTVAGGTSVPRMLKIIKAFCNSVGDSLDHVLGNPDTQSTDPEIVKQKAVEYRAHLLD